MNDERKALVESLREHARIVHEPSLRNALRQAAEALSAQSAPPAAEADSRIVKCLLDQAAHIEDNASKLKTFAGSEDEARFRELCASYLRELAALVLMDRQLNAPANESNVDKGTS